MKRLFKKLIGFIAVVVMAISSLTFTACSGNGTTLEFTVKVYDSSVGKVVEKTMDIDLYKSVAPKTVDAIVKYAKDGYYNGMTFYIMTSFDGSSAYSSQIMFGDLSYDAVNKVLALSDTFGEKPFLDGEYKNAGYIGNNLKNEKGSIGLWRTWQKGDGDSYKTSNWSNTGKATWYIPTSTISDYDDSFCVFGKINLNDETTSNTWSKISAVCNNSSLTKSFVIYYTGEYTADDAVVNNGLEFHCLPTEDFEALSEAEKDEVFVPEVGQYVKYAKTTVKIPVRADGSGYQPSAAYVESVKVK